MSREILDYLHDMLDALNKVVGFVADLDYNQFVSDDKTVFAVIRALEVVGEAAKHIPDEIRTKHPQVPWREMTGMRDVLIHDYFGVDSETIWNTVTGKIPQAIEFVSEVIKEQENV